MNEDCSDTLKKMHKVVIDKAVDDLVTAKLNNASNKDMRKSYSTYMETFQIMGASIDKAALYMRVSREYSKRRPLALPVEEVETNGLDNDMSSISSPDISNAPEINDEPLPRGNTKGNTKAKREKDAQDYINCINEITYDYATTLTTNKLTKKGHHKVIWKI